MKLSDKISGSLSTLGSTIKSFAKIALQSRRCTISAAPREFPIVILGNGPSLLPAITTHGDLLREIPALAVNFAANTPEFRALRPRYYAIADPHFFETSVDPNVCKLINSLENHVEWPMTLFIPNRAVKRLALNNPNIRIERFNPVAVEGLSQLKDFAFTHGLGMPRPRNVMIVAIMCAIRAGFKKIYLAGADHSWLKTLDVSENNEVISVQPHFYEESDSEKSRVNSIYKNVKLHEILLSFHLAFRSYHEIRRYAAKHGITIYNSTPGSFIDAFPRKPLSEIKF